MIRDLALEQAGLPVPARSSDVGTSSRPPPRDPLRRASSTRARSPTAEDPQTTDRVTRQTTRRKAIATGPRRHS